MSAAQLLKQKAGPIFPFQCYSEGCATLQSKECEYQVSVFSKQVPNLNRSLVCRAEYRGKTVF